MSLIITMSRLFVLGLLLSTRLPLASGVKHHLFVSNLSPPSSLYALEFDDETLDLHVTANMTADAPHSWIAFNHDKTNIYGTSNIAPRVASYAVTSNSTLKLIKSVPAAKTCSNHTSAFAVASPVAPYHVITGAWPGPNACGMSFNVSSNGTLDAVSDSWGYANKSGVHGLALGAQDKELLYSADLNGDAIWTHRVGEDGRAEYVGKFGVEAGSHPRHLAAHPAGKRLYVVMEAGNRVAAFLLDGETTVADAQESTYSLIPDGYNSSNYWSAEVMLSRDARYLWLTTRAQVNTNITGYVSAFLLDDEGVIVRQMFRVPTTTVNGIANMISPAPWGSEWAALTDVGTGYVQIWKMKDKTEGRHGTEYASVEAVAKADIRDGGCCAVALWYD